MIDRFGHREYWFVGCATVLFLAFLFVLTIPRFPAALLTVMVGLGYTAIGPLAWSTIPLVVTTTTAGLGFGIAKFAQNAGVGALTAIAGGLLDIGQNPNVVPWMNLLILLLVTSLLCCILAGLIVWLDRKTSSRLTFSQKERSERYTAQENTPLNVDFERKQEPDSRSRLSSANSTKSTTSKSREPPIST